MGDESGMRKKFQQPLPEVEEYSPLRATTKMLESSKKSTHIQSHALQSHKSILAEPTPPKSKVR